MSWICVGCSTRHPDNLDTMGFGLCRECADDVKKRKAEEKAIMIAKRQAMFGNQNKTKSKAIKVRVPTRAIKVKKVKVSKKVRVKASKKRKK